MFKFTSKTHVAINVVLANGSNMHVSFSELTGKGSVYYTDSQDVANALRRHHKFGKLFKELIVEAAKPAANVTAATVAKAAGSQEPEKKVIALTFDGNEDAKDYLADKYGISRSKMRTRAAIEEVASSVGVTINWGA